MAIYGEFSPIFPVKMNMIHSYVKWPEGKFNHVRFRKQPIDVKYLMKTSDRNWKPYWIILDLYHRFLWGIDFICFWSECQGFSLYNDAIRWRQNRPSTIGTTDGELTFTFWSPPDKTEYFSCTSNVGPPSYEMVYASFEHYSYRYRKP